MHIAFLVNIFPSTSETFVLNQITGLVDRGCTVTIFALSSQKDKVVHPDVHKYKLLEKTIYLNSPQFGTFNSLKKLVHLLFIRKGKKKPLFEAMNFFKYGTPTFNLKILREILPFIVSGETYDVLHCQFGTLGERGVFLKEIGAIDSKIVVSMRGYDITKYVYENGKDVYANLFKRADLFLPVCAYFKTLLVNVGCPPFKIFVHYSGISFAKFEFKPRIGSSTNSFKILTVGRLVEKKGVCYGLQAVKYFTEKYPTLSISYKVIGDGPLLGELKQQAVDLGIGEKVIFCGALGQSEIVSALHESDVFLAPHVTASNNDQEGIPNVLKEAMAVGLPVVSTFHSGIPELVEDGVTGYLVKERASDQLAEALEMVFVNQGRNKDMIMSARESVIKKFDINNLNEELVRLYKSIT